MITLTATQEETVKAYVSQFIEDMGEEFQQEEGHQWFVEIDEDEDVRWAIQEACMANYEQFQIGGYTSYYKI